MNIQKTIDNMTIPAGLSKEELFDFCGATFHKLNCNAETFRKAVYKRLMKEQGKIVKQNMLDILIGKYQSRDDMRERMPLFRDGDTLRNIPDSIMGWYGFMAWANDLAMKARVGGA